MLNYGGLCPLASSSRPPGNGVFVCLVLCVSTRDKKCVRSLCGSCQPSFYVQSTFMSGIYDQGAVGGAGEPSGGSSVLLSLQSIPKDTGGVPWAPSPPCESFLGQLLVYCEDHVSSQNICQAKSPFKNRQ